MNEQQIAFDTSGCQEVSEFREIWLKKVLAVYPYFSQLSTALDVACGAGHFSSLLHDAGLMVKGVDLQDGNLRVCRQRYPTISFDKLNLDEEFESPGVFDLVLMFGILYHLESPLQSVLRLKQSIGRVGIVETRVAARFSMACYLFNEYEGAEDNKSG